MKRLLFLLMGVVMIMNICGCGSKEKYQVYFDANGFETKKTAYAEGETVHVVYDGIATDTDYRFFCDPDVDLKQEFDGAHSFLFDFVMPGHDVTLYLKKSNTMTMDTGKKEEEDLIAQIDPDKLVFGYTAKTEAAPGSHDYTAYALYEREKDGQLILARTTEDEDGEDQTVACLVPAVTLERSLGIAKRYGMREWKDGHGLRGKSYSVRLKGEDGELQKISSDDMPEDGRRAFDEIEQTLGSAFAQFFVPKQKPAPSVSSDTDEPIKPWICPECGLENTGKYCSECGSKMPE